MIWKYEMSVWLRLSSIIIFQVVTAPSVMHNLVHSEEKPQIEWNWLCSVTSCLAFFWEVCNAWLDSELKWWRDGITKIMLSSLVFLSVSLLDHCSWLTILEVTGTEKQKLIRIIFDSNLNGKKEQWQTMKTNASTRTQKRESPLPQKHKKPEIQMAFNQVLTSLPLTH